MTNTYIEFNASDLNRNPAKVFDTAGRHPVLLRRRNGQDMILVSKRELKAREEGQEILALLITAATAPEKIPGDNLMLFFPWLTVFNVETQKDFSNLLFEAGKNFLSSGLALPLTDLVHEWRDRASKVREDEPLGTPGLEDS
jgi:hypothetical protein